MALAVLVVVAAPASQAATPEPAATALTYDYGGLCRRYIAEAEAHYGIVAGVLEAMGEVEAGYANTIWPWAVSIGGQALYANSESEAIDAIRHAVRDGKSNIDIGCLQINWHWHSDRASGPEVFLNPRANVYYAARHLADLEAEFGSLGDAVMAYHSRDPERAQAYLCRVYRVLLRRYPEIREAVDEECPGMFAERPLADDFVADWRAVAAVVDRPEARPAPASPTDGRATRMATYPNDPVSEPPAARIAADTAAPPVPSQNAQAGQAPSDADARSRCPNTIDHLRSADLARETDPAVSASARPGKTQQAFAPPAHTGKPALPVRDRAGDPEAPAQDVLDLDVDDIAPALRTVEPGWDPFPEPGP